MSEDVLVSIITTIGIIAVAYIGQWGARKAIRTRRRRNASRAANARELAQQEQSDAALADYENNPGAFVARVMEDNAQKHAELKELTERIKGFEASLSELRTEVGRLRDRYSRKMSAVARILRAIADQWPSAHGPNLDPRDIEEIEDTIPVQWIRRPPQAGPIQPL